MGAVEDQLYDVLLGETMISLENILAVSCPKCGARAGLECRAFRRATRATQHGQRLRRAIEERNFWKWIDTQLADPRNAGMSEQDLLDSVKRPGWMGRKARANSRTGVVMMPSRDFRKAAAGDSDEAA
jgi:hypothetical protein